jgi:hypothetical protein
MYCQRPHTSPVAHMASPTIDDQMMNRDHNGPLTRNGVK